MLVTDFTTTTTTPVLVVKEEADRQYLTINTAVEIRVLIVDKRPGVPLTAPLAASFVAGKSILILANNSLTNYPLDRFHAMYALATTTGGIGQTWEFTS